MLKCVRHGMTDQTHFWVLLLLAADAAEAALKSSSRSSGPHRGLKTSPCQTKTARTQIIDHLLTDADLSLTEGPPGWLLEGSLACSFEEDPEEGS